MKTIKFILTFLLISLSIQLSSGKTLVARYEVPIDREIVLLSNQILYEQVGTVEKQPNWGGKVIDYIASVGLHSPIKYCGAGQYYCLSRAALELNKSPKIEIPFVARSCASSQYWFIRAKQIGKKTDFVPQVNDLIIWRSRKDASSGHIGRIVAVGEAGWIVTIEFNTSSGTTGSQANGGGVFKRQRQIFSPLGILSIRGLVGLKYEQP